MSWFKLIWRNRRRKINNSNAQAFFVAIVA